ncbi:MAG: hypothetical protein ACP5E3_03985 [Bacteroidales bacterium]
MAPKEDKNFTLPKENLILSLFALTAGFTIYIFLRSSDLVFFQWAHHLGIRDFINSFRLDADKSDLQIPAWFIFSLPDGLWAFAYTYLIIGIWSGDQSKYKFIWYVSIPGLLIGHECLQLFGIINGTYSTEDLVFEFLGIGIALLLQFKKDINQYYHEKKFV